MNLSLFSSTLVRPRSGRRLLPWFAFLVASLGPASPGWAAVEFPARQPAYLVTTPASALEERVVGQLSSYVGRVLGEPARRVATLEQVPHGAPAIVLTLAGRGPWADAQVPADSPEAFSLATRRELGRSLVVATGRTDR
ncbi:MAG TPA: hypothetical protein PKX00_06895, partial [Opitutaceae bacterium]|nr:hypothetical protein [Opitutaceae bacterium]